LSPQTATFMPSSGGFLQIKKLCNYRLSTYQINNSFSPINDVGYLMFQMVEFEVAKPKLNYHSTNILYKKRAAILQCQLFFIIFSIKV
jgi:hypothetical protein